MKIVFFLYICNRIFKKENNKYIYFFSSFYIEKSVYDLILIILYGGSKYCLYDIYGCSSEHKTMKIQNLDKYK